MRFDGREVPPDLIRRMASALSHRGPDDEGIYSESGPSSMPHQDVSVGLGHRRLSIIDLSREGRQPLSNERGTLHLVFNGEIYNYQALAQELKEKGHRFSSRTDCEAILHLYEEEGIECLRRLEGMFAFALWDREKQTLFLVRDRLGIKPAVYSWDGRSFLFASEIKSILADPEISRTIDAKALGLYLTLNYVPSPYTIFRGINKLNPGCYLEVRRNGLHLKKYWDVPHETTPPEEGERPVEVIKKELFSLFEKTVAAHLAADVPLGAFLSGGIDSSIIVGLMSRVSPSPVNTYTIGFEDMPMFDETGYAREVAEFHRTNHHEIKLSGQGMIRAVPDVLEFFDEPFADSSAVPTYIVSRETRQHVKVALSGDGGDELFAGYRMYAGERLYSRYRLIPKILRTKMIAPLVSSLPDSRDKPLLDRIRRIKKFVSGAEDRFEDRFFAWNEIFSRELRQKILRKDGLGVEDIDDDLGREAMAEFLNSHPGDPINRMLFCDTKYSLPNDMLAKVDLMSMRNSLEVRVPFLDHRIVEYAFRLPGSLKLRGKRGKHILLETFKEILPAALHSRPKWGFEIPIGKWLKTGLKFLLHEHLSEDRIKKQGLFNFEAIRPLIGDLLGNRKDTSWQLWNLIVFQSWHARHFGR